MPRGLRKWLTGGTLWLAVHAGESLVWGDQSGAPGSTRHAEIVTNNLSLTAVVNPFTSPGVQPFAEPRMAASGATSD